MRDIVERQVFRREYLVPVQARYGGLSRGQHPEVVFLVVVHLLAEAGQVSAGLNGVPVDHIGQIYFGVSMPLDVHIYHERNQRALKLCSKATENEEARAGEPNAAFEVHYAQVLGDVPVRLRLEVEGWEVADSFDLDVCRLIGADRGGFVRDVRDLEHESV